MVVRVDVAGNLIRVGRTGEHNFAHDLQRGHELSLKAVGVVHSGWAVGQKGWGTDSGLQCGFH